jgi:hypothetical protein
MFKRGNGPLVSFLLPTRKRVRWLAEAVPVAGGGGACGKTRLAAGCRTGGGCPGFWPENAMPRSAKN